MVARDQEAAEQHVRAAVRRHARADRSGRAAPPPWPRRRTGRRGCPTTTRYPAAPGGLPQPLRHHGSAQ